MFEAKIFLLIDYTGSTIKNNVFSFSQILIVFKKSFLLFSKMKIFWNSNLRVEFNIFYLFFFLKICTCVFLNDIDKSVCGKFFIVLQLEDIKENWKDFVSTCFKKPDFPILHYNHRTKQTKKMFYTHFWRRCKHCKENTCSKFQRKMIISTWQIGNKLIKNNDINSNDNNINMN